MFKKLNILLLLLFITNHYLYAASSSNVTTQDTSCTSSSQSCNTSSAYIRCEIYGYSPTASPSANQQALQNCINANTNASITKAGTYPTTFGLTIPSNHSLYIGGGVTIQQASGASKPFITNQNYKASATVVSGGISLANNVATVAVPGGSSNFKVGGYIEITQDTNNLYNGVFQITATTSSNVSFLANGFTEGTSSNLRVAPADANIIITGGGTIDANSQSTSGCTIGLNGMGMLFNRIGNLQVSNVSMLNVCNYAIETGNIFNSSFTNLYFDTLKDGLHNDGPFLNVLVDGISGSTSDDAVVFLAADGTSYTAFDPEDACQPLNGPLNGKGSDCTANYSGTLNPNLLSGYGLTIKNVHMTSTKGTCLFRIMPDAMLGGYSNINISDSSIDSPGFSSPSGNPLNMGGAVCIAPPVSTTGILSGFTANNIQNAAFSIDAIIDTATISNINTPASYINTGVGGGDGTNGWINISGQANQINIQNVNLSFNQSSSNNNGNALVTVMGNINNLYLSNININGIGSNSVVSLINPNSGGISNLFLTGGETNGNSRVLNIANCNSFNLGIFYLSNFVVNGNIGNADFSEYNCQITYNIVTSTFSANANGMAFNLWHKSTGTQNVNLTNSVISSGNYWYRTNGTNYNASFNFINVQSNAVMVASTSGNDILNISADNITQTVNPFLYITTGSPTININASKISANSFLSISNSNPVINYNNPDFTAPVDFTKIVKTNYGYSAAPNNNTLQMTNGAYPGQNTPFISNGTNWVDLLNNNITY